MTDAIPPDGIFRTADHRYFDHGAGPLTSVTTAMKLYDKSDALVGWAKKETSRFAMANLHVLVAHREHSGEGIIEEGCPPCETEVKRRNKVGMAESARIWVSSIPDLIKDSAADLGTRVHGVAEKIANGIVDLPDLDVAPFALQYQEWREAFRPAYHAIEYVGVNRTHGYAGTGDFVASLDHPDYDGVWAIDIKSHTKDTPLPATYYPETGMQLAACSRLEVVGTDVVHLPNDALLARDVRPFTDITPPIRGHAVLLLGREDYRFVPYAVTDRTFEAFLSCLSLSRWRHGEAKTYVGSAA
jgi:hypothetical protein